MSFRKLIVLAAIACICNTTANTLWKIQFNKKPLNISCFSDIIHTFLTANIIGGVFFYLFSMLLFFYMLSHFNLSVIVPVTSLTYVFNIIAAYFIFNEKLSINQLIGTGIIMLGLLVLSKS